MSFVVPHCESELGFLIVFECGYEQGVWVGGVRIDLGVKRHTSRNHVAAMIFQHWVRHAAILDLLTFKVINLEPDAQIFIVFLTDRLLHQEEAKYLDWAISCDLHLQLRVLAYWIVIATTTRCAFRSAPLVLVVNLNVLLAEESAQE